MMDTHYKLLTGLEVEADKLDRFMRCCFPTAKSDFLRDHGAWWHRGNEHRYVAVEEETGELAGYSAIIPVEVLVAGKEHSAIWSVDFYVPPEFRGRVIQRLIDQTISDVAALHIGFPNDIAAVIHKKHGWGVRSDYRVMMLPLKPLQVPHYRALRGWKRYLFRTAMGFLTPVAWVYTRWLAQRRITTVKAIEQPTAEFLAGIFQQQKHDLITINRTASHFQWRYLDAPYRDQLMFFVAGDDSKPSLAAVIRIFVRRDVTIARILDLFGDLEDRPGLSALLRFITVEMAKTGVVYIAAMVTRPELVSVFRLNGFIMSTSSRFCWRSTDPEIMSIIGENPGHWCLGDSDNDSID